MNDISVSVAMELWHQAGAYDWDATPDRCVACGTAFRTGDIFIQFSDPANAVMSKATACVRCGVVVIAEGALRPEAAGVYVEDRHRGLPWEDLSEEERTRVLSGFVAVDRIATGVKESVS